MVFGLITRIHPTRWFNAAGNKLSFNNPTLPIFPVREIRRSFLSGVLTFDGCIDKKRGTVHFESYSKYLFESCLEIIMLSGIEKVYSGSTRRGSFYISIYPKYFLKGMRLFRENSDKDIIMQKYIK